MKATGQREQSGESQTVNPVNPTLFKGEIPEIKLESLILAQNERWRRA